MFSKDFKKFFTSRKNRGSGTQNTSDTAIITQEGVLIRAVSENLQSHDSTHPARPHSSDETESSSIDFQNAKETVSYTGEIVTEIHLPPKSTHSSATTTIIPTFFRNDYEGEQEKSGDDVEVLKLLIHRLNAELDKYQRKFRPLTPAEVESIDGLPFKGPHPTWLVSAKQLSPLLLAYDEQLNNLNDVINAMKVEMENFRQEMEDITLENKRLHLQIEMTSFDFNNQKEMPMTQLKKLKLHCALVLEENQIILKQLNLEKEKFKKVITGQAQQVLDLTKRFTLVTLERDKLMFENKELKTQLSDLRVKPDFTTNSKLSIITQEEHLQEVQRLQQCLQQCRKEHTEALHEVVERNKEEKNECKRIAENLKQKIQRLNSILKRKKTKEKIIKCKLRMLKTKKGKMSKSNSGIKGFLFRVLNTAELTAQERNILLDKVKDRERETLTDLIQMLKTSIVVNNFKEKAEILSLKGNEKHSTAKRRLKDHSQVMNLQKQQYDKEMKVLKSILEERDDNCTNIMKQNRSVFRDLRELNERSRCENRTLMKYISRIYQVDLKSPRSLFPEEIMNVAKREALSTLKLMSSDLCDSCRV